MQWWPAQDDNKGNGHRAALHVSGLTKTPERSHASPSHHPDKETEAPELGSLPGSLLVSDRAGTEPGPAYHQLPLSQEGQLDQFLNKEKEKCRREEKDE